MVPVDWIDKHAEMLPQWVRTTKVPMAVTTLDEFLWINAAWEQMLDYTVAEIRKKTWQDLTATAEDADDDSEMAALLYEDRLGRQSYEFRKSYRRKSGEMVPVVIDVIRYPRHGDFEAFMVTAMPIDSHSQVALSEIRELRDELIRFTSQESSGLTWGKVWDWASVNPVKAGALLAFLFAYLGGDRVLEIMVKLREIFFGGASK